MARLLHLTLQSQLICKAERATLIPSLTLIHWSFNDIKTRHIQMSPFPDTLQMSMLPVFEGKGQYKEVLDAQVFSTHSKLSACYMCVCI